jgi:hypothetical protein
VVFRRPGTPAPEEGQGNFPKFDRVYDIAGTWSVRFDSRWGGPSRVEFPQLVSWTQRPEKGIRYYSGTGMYVKEFDVPSELLSHEEARLWLDLGDVRQLAEVRLNGSNLGVLWTYPFRVDVDRHIRGKGNRLEVDVVNFWPNRIIGDHQLPAEKRFTRTNIRKLTMDTPLLESGLLGPVTLQSTRYR